MIQEHSGSELLFIFFTQEILAPLAYISSIIFQGKHHSMTLVVSSRTFHKFLNVLHLFLVDSFFFIKFMKHLDHDCIFTQLFPEINFYFTTK